MTTVLRAEDHHYPREEQGIIRITKSREVSSTNDRAWNVISDLENEKKYWPVIEDVKILRRDGNTTEREATIMRGPIGNTKSIQTLILDPKRSTTLRITKGILIGTRKIALRPSSEGKTRIEISWEFELNGIPEFAHSFVKNNISTMTENALSQIAQDAEYLGVKSSRSHE